MRFILSSGILLLALAPLCRAQAEDFVVDVYPTKLTLSKTTWLNNDSINYSVEIVNASWFVAVGPHNVGFYYSRDATISTTDKLIRTVRSQGIAWGYLQRWTLNMKAERSWFVDGKTYFGCYADTGNEIAETIETNNTTSQPVTTSFPYTDMTVQKLEIPAKMTAGTTHTITVQLKNAGGIKASPCRANIHVSSNASITMQDPRVGGINEILEAQSVGKEHKIAIHIPCYARASTWYVAVWCDYGTWLKEVNRGNDVVKKAFTVIDPPKGTRRVEFIPHQLYPTRSYNYAEMWVPGGPFCPMAVSAKDLPFGYQLCAWSLSSAWNVDAATSISLGLLNNGAWFPGWFSKLSAAGTSFPASRIPKGFKLPGQIMVYTKAFFFDASGNFVGPSSNVIRSRLYK